MKVFCDSSRAVVPLVSVVVATGDSLDVVCPVVVVVVASVDI